MNAKLRLITMGSMAIIPSSALAMSALAQGGSQPAATAEKDAVSEQWLQDAPVSVYDGKPVKLSVAENGALINDDLKRDPFMKSDPQLTQMNDRVWVIHGYSLANCTFVVTDKGVVVFDTGNNLGQGRHFLSVIRSVTSKPVIAIIYSHSHYIGGAAAFRDGASDNVAVYAHPGLAENSLEELSLAPARWRRANMQFGAYLPEEGKDARATSPEHSFEDPADRAFAALPVTHRVSDGEVVKIGGISFKFLWTTADTPSSLSVWIPELETVLTNTVSNMYYPLYTLRGQRYRDPDEIIASYDRLRALPIQYYAPVHGQPLRGQKKVYQTLTQQRDAYSFTYNQSIRAINAGMTPDEMARLIKLPKHLADAPGLYEVYSELSYAVRGIYRGLMGWFDEDTTELNPPDAQILARAIVDGFGGSASLLEAASRAQEGRQYNLAARLAKYAVEANPDDEAARLVLAQSLRKLAEVSVSLQSHNFYLTEALDMEGKVDRMEPPDDPVFPNPARTRMTRLPTLPLAKLLETRINPAKTAELEKTYLLQYSDTNEQIFVQIRRGVAEVTDALDGRVDEELVISREALINILSGADSGDACSAGDRNCAFFYSFY